MTRTTTATYENPAGKVWTAAPGVARITTNGLLVEPARTNYVLQSATANKAAEATGTLPTGACVGWHDGTGNMTIANGTATTTGLSCAAVAPGTLCTFTVTVGGTMAITTAAGATHAQIECVGSYRTSRIVTTTTAVIRNADVVSATVPAVSKKFCLAASAYRPNGTTWLAGSLNKVFAEVGNRITNTFDVGIDGVAKPYWEAADTAGNWRYTNAASVSVVSDVSHRLGGCFDAWTLTQYLDGAQLAATFTTIGTPGTLTPATTMYLGSGANGTNYQIGGFLKNVKLCNGNKAADAWKVCK